MNDVELNVWSRETLPLEYLIHSCVGKGDRSPRNRLANSPRREPAPANHTCGPEYVGTQLPIRKVRRKFLWVTAKHGRSMHVPTEDSHVQERVSRFGTPPGLPCVWNTVTASETSSEQDGKEHGVVDGLLNSR